MKLRYFAWVRERVGKPEEELDVPTYGAKFRMDLSKMPDVRTVVLVEE